MGEKPAAFQTAIKAILVANDIETISDLVVQVRTIELCLLPLLCQARCKVARLERHTDYALTEGSSAGCIE